MRGAVFASEEHLHRRRHPLCAGAFAASPRAGSGEALYSPRHRVHGGGRPSGRVYGGKARTFAGVRRHAHLRESAVLLRRDARAHRQAAEDIYRAYKLARQFPFEINLDLIAGLTGESVPQFCESVDRAIALEPENITVHTLCLKKGARLKEEESFLEGGGIAEMIAYARSRLYAAGYTPYYLYRQKYMAGNFENTGWTRPGKACIYNVDVMEEITDNIACGANAVTKKLFAGEGRIERLGSPKDIPTYIAKARKVAADKRRLFGKA